VVVWVHGGARVSGRTENVVTYLRLLTSDRFAMVNVGYTLAPSVQHPEPTR
jgi:acetyl esterase/lipase